MKKIIALILISSSLFSWQGYDYEKGAYVDISKGNLVRSGREIEYYDYDDGEYKTAHVDKIRDRGSRVDLEVTDSETGETKTFEMKEE